MDEPQLPLQSKEAMSRHLLAMELSGLAGSSESELAPSTTEAAPAPPPVDGGTFRRRLAEWVRASDGWWLPVVVCASGSLFSIVVSSALRFYEENELETTLMATASELARTIESRFKNKVEDLRDLGLAWSTFEPQDVPRWESDSKRLLKRWEEILAVEWGRETESDHSLKLGTPEGVQLLTRLREDEQARRSRAEVVEGRLESFLGPFEFPEGQVYELILPIQQGESAYRILTALVEPTVFLDSVVSEATCDCALTVMRDEHVLYRHDEVPLDGASRPSKEEAIRLSPGKEWTLTVRPSQSWLMSLNSRLSRIALYGGLAASILLAAMLRLSQLGSQGLLQTNLGLQERLRKAEKLVTTLRGKKQQLQKETVVLKAEAETRDQAAVHQDSIVAELEAFTYSVSHDLRSPLGAILNYAAALAEDYGDRLGATGRDHLARISASAQSAVAMMDALLGFSRVGRHELNSSYVDVREVVHEVYEELSRANQGQQPQLSMGEVPGIHADPTLLRVLFTNLLSNAFKFTRQVRDARVEVGGYAQGAEIVYYVEDNGIGFDMRSASRLFGVFERIHGSPEYEGHGVGLAVVERIARRHGGSVRAEGVAGKGATFFVTLPYN